VADVTALLLAPPAAVSTASPAAESHDRAIARIRPNVLPYLAAVALALPLFALALWSGLRIGLSDSVLSAITTSEQPLSVRSPGGVWAVALALLWFALAYWRREAPPWQAALVALGATAALLRTGNAWFDGVLLIAPLGAQLTSLRLRPIILCAIVAAGVLVAGHTLWTTRPPVLPRAAIEAAQTSSSNGTVFADWRWAGELQQHLVQPVLASGGLASASPDFWLDYVRITQDRERWATELRDLNADLVVLNADQRQVVEQVRASSQWHVLYAGADAFVAERVRS
jgi:hypothetical protein